MSADIKSAVSVKLLPTGVWVVVNRKGTANVYTLDDTRKSKKLLNKLRKKLIKCKS